jgi:beta-fructofuranosidase
MWNDHAFDRLALFSGSATIVDGHVVVIYPGLCNSTSSEWPSCTCQPNNYFCRNDTTNHYAHNMISASPANLSDPTYTHWHKRILINNTDADYSAAWRTPSGEWRLTGASGLVYGSQNFHTWHEIGVQPGFKAGSCPSFFALPRLTPGADPAPAGAQRYNFVHKISSAGDWMQVGTYAANSPMMNGSWVGAEPQLIDAGFKQGELFYASKDFFDPVKGRRINWGWQTGGTDNSNMSLTLAREVTWHPALSQLVFSPLDEQDLLRGQLLTAINHTQLDPTQVLSLGSWADSVGNQSEVEVTFAIPTHAARFGVIVMAGADPVHSGTLFYVQFAPAPITSESKIRTVTVGAMSMSRDVSSVEAGSLTDTLRLEETDTSISLRVYVDNVFAEAFWQGGRVAMTVKTPPTVEAAMAVTSTEAVVLESAQVWQVNSIWVSVEAILHSHRPTFVAAEAQPRKLDDDPGAPLISAEPLPGRLRSSWNKPSVKSDDGDSYDLLRIVPLLLVEALLLPPPAAGLLWFPDAPNNLGDLDGLVDTDGTFYMRYNNGACDLDGAVDPRCAAGPGGHCDPGISNFASATLKDGVHWFDHGAMMYAFDENASCPKTGSGSGSVWRALDNKTWMINYSGETIRMMTAPKPNGPWMGVGSTARTGGWGPNAVPSTQADGKQWYAGGRWDTMNTWPAPASDITGNSMYGWITVMGGKLKNTITGFALSKEIT